MPRRRIPYIVLLTFLLAIPIYLRKDPMESEEAMKSRYWYNKVTDKKIYPVVFAGDSRVFRGVSPAHFDRVFGSGPSFNFAFWSNGYGKIYLDGLEARVDTSADPPVIVLGISPHSLTPSGAKCAHYIFEMERSRKQVLPSVYLDLAKEAFRPYQLIELYDRASGNIKPSNLRITYHSDGWVESTWIVPDTTYSARFYRDIFTDNRVSETVISELMERVRSWRSRGIRVAGFRPPTSQTIRYLEKERGGFDEDAFVKDFSAAGGIWIPVENDRYETYDGNHLDRDAAIRFSEDLALSIRERL